MTCPKCHGTKWVPYDHNHSSKCGYCCKHDEGFWFLTEHYSKAGNWCCLAGCGFILQFNPDEYGKDDTQSELQTSD